MAGLPQRQGRPPVLRRLRQENGADVKGLRLDDGGVHHVAGQKTRGDPVAPRSAVGEEDLMVGAWCVWI